jgi:hypothetical protein
MYNFNNTKLNAVIVTLFLGIVEFIFANSLFHFTQFHFTAPILFIYFFGAQILFFIGIINSIRFWSIKPLLNKLLEGLVLIILAVGYRFIFPL